MLRDALVLPAILGAIPLVLAVRLTLLGRPFLPALGDMFLYEATLLFWAGVLTSAGIRSRPPGRFAVESEEFERSRRPVGLFLVGASVVLVLLYRAIEAVT